jgi:outer membrane receptor protein involved in Fe transport
MRQSLVTSITVSTVIAFLSVFNAESAVAGDLKETRSYQIAPQSLDSALLEFSDQSDIQLVMAAQLASNLDSPGLTAEIPGEQALKELLDNTGLGFEIVGNTVTIFLLDSSQDSINNSTQRVVGSAPSADQPSELGESLAGPVSSRTEYSFDAGERELEEIVVTGSQIRGSDVGDSLPVTVLSTTAIEATGASSGDELFRQLVGAGAVSFGTSATRSVVGGVNGARGDVASINLRSLGTGNTLVLINGRRMVNHPTVQTDPPGLVPVSSANMNAIPVSGLARVEVLRDGASAIYGTDAVAGVVNNVLRGKFEGLEVSARYGEPANSAGQDLMLNVYGGMSSRSGNTNITLNTTIYQRQPMQTSDRRYAQSRDLRPLISGTGFDADAEFNNTSSTTPWGRFSLPNPVTIGGVSSSSFHIQPTTLPGCLAPVPGGPADICIDDGPIDSELFYDSNAAAGQRSMNNEVERLNHFMTFSHMVREDLEWFGEASWFQAESSFQRAFGNTPISSHPLWIPGENYWNPFGAVNLPDGSPNPNRIPGLDLAEVPAEGLLIPLHGASDYRILDGGNRKVFVDDRSWRLVAGLRGSIPNSEWSIDTAALFSEATSTDLTEDRISNSAFQNAAALATPDAYNFFNGAGAGNLVIDGTPNSANILNGFYGPSIKYTKSTLALADAKFSNPNAFAKFRDGVGIAIGVEYRTERYIDDRDPRLDGTFTFTNYLGDTFESDTMNSSPTPDTKGERNVWSTFVELAIPVVNEEMSVPLVQSLDVQLAARHERFSDIGIVTKPKIALSWRIFDELRLRASYAEGFGAPNLAQTSDGITRRVRNATDWYYCQAQVNKGVVPNMSSCDGGTGAGNNINTGVERLSFGSDQLMPEETKNYSYGIVWNPSFLEGLTFSADYWRITQADLIGLFGAPNQLALDWALRINNLGGNPLVVRSDPTPEEIAFFAGSGLQAVGEAIQTLDGYLNLDTRDASGAEFELHYRLENSAIGSFDIDFALARLFEKFQSVSGPGAFINAQNEAAVEVRAAGDLLKRNRDPKVRATGSVRWYRQNWDASIHMNYVGEVFDTSATNDTTGEWWVVEDWLTTGVRIGYTFNEGSLEGTRFVLGIRNLTNEDPPLADASFGFLPQLHDPYGRYWYLSAKYIF